MWGPSVQGMAGWVGGSAGSGLGPFQPVKGGLGGHLSPNHARESNVSKVRFPTMSYVHRADRCKTCIFIKTAKIWTGTWLSCMIVARMLILNEKLVCALVAAQPCSTWREIVKIFIHSYAFSSMSSIFINLYPFQIHLSHFISIFVNLHVCQHHL